MRALGLGLLLILAIGCRTTPGSGDGGDGSGGSGGSGGSVDMARDGGHVCTIFCTMGFSCCDNRCVNLNNDIHNCGACGNVCSGPQPFCDGTACAPAPCSPACPVDQLCCNVQGPGPTRGPACYAPTAQGTCPLGCPLCQ
jgi:hypothetical protein